MPFRADDDHYDDDNDDYEDDINLNKLQREVSQNLFSEKPAKKA
jgi:hypothetical protein